MCYEALHVERFSIEGRGPRPPYHVSESRSLFKAILKSICRQAVKVAECDEAMAAEIEVAEACRQMVREGDEAMTAHIQEQLHVLHRVVEEDQTQAKGNNCVGA